MAKTIGIDVGGTNLRIGIFDSLTLIEAHHVHANLSQLSEKIAPKDVTAEIIRVLAKSIRECTDKHPDVQAIGIGFPGFIDPVSQVISLSPNIKGLQNINLANDLSLFLGQKVVVENDALAAAFGEYHLHGQPASGLIYMGLGTGVGGGMIVANQPFTGSHGVAMEVGHLIVEADGRLCGCGNKGCLEQYASATGISKSYHLLTQKVASAAQIAAYADQGDVHAITAFADAAKALARTLAHVQKIVDIPTVVIGGGVSAAWHLMQETFNATLAQDLIPVLRGKIQVYISQADDKAGMLGAALLALKKT